MKNLLLIAIFGCALGFGMGIPQTSFACDPEVCKAGGGNCVCDQQGNCACVGGSGATNIKAQSTQQNPSGTRARISGVTIKPAVYDGKFTLKGEKWVLVPIKVNTSKGQGASGLYITNKGPEVNPRLHCEVEIDGKKYTKWESSAASCTLVMPGSEAGVTYEEFCTFGGGECKD